MHKLTWGDVKNELRRVAGVTGLTVDDPRLLELANLAQERLCSLGEWPFQYARLKFAQYGGLVTLPTEYEAIVHADVNREQTPVHGQWYEFIGSGPGQLDRGSWFNVGIDRGESPVFRQPGAGGLRVRVDSLADERVNGVRPKITFFGYDEDGLWVRTDRGEGPRDGVDLELRGDSAENTDTTTVKFSRVTQVKKPLTNGEVIVSYVDDYGQEYEAARYRHVDVNPSFRQYLFPHVGAASAVTITAILRRRRQILRHDSDPLIVTNVGALRLAVKALACEDKDDHTNAAIAIRTALTLLTREAELYKSTAGKPPVDVPPVMAFGGADLIY